MRDLERERADDALAKVKSLEGRSNELRMRYRAYVDRFGGAVVMNGLGQALATELAAAGAGDHDGSDDKIAHRALVDNVCGWLVRDGGIYPGARDVMEAITSNDQQHYIRAQVETLAWLTWHKKFCHASLPRGGDV